MHDKRHADATDSWFEREDGLLDALRHASDEPVPQVDGYTRLQVIGRGGQAVVYGALDTQTDRLVAIKVIRQDRFGNPRDRRRFEREIELVSSLDHPNLVKVHQAGTLPDDRAYLVMDHVQGVQLDEYVLGPDRSGPPRLDVPAALQLFCGIADAVHYAHLNGVIHRDLKPANIRVGADGAPTVLDFGLATAPGPADALTGRSALTGTGEFLGTLAWSSPEQIDGRLGAVDVRSDIFSLGVILYQMLAGCLPFRSDGPLNEVIEQRLQTRPSSLTTHADVNEDVETILLRCLAREPARRYQSVAELVRDIRRQLAGEPIEARRDGAWYRAQIAVRRYRIGIAVAAVVAIVLVGSTIALAVMYNKADRSRVLAQQQQREATTQAESARDALRFLLQTIAMANPASPQSRGNTSMRSMLDQAAGSFERDLAAQPVSRREVSLALGRAYYSLGDYQTAARLIEGAIVTDRQVTDSAAVGWGGPAGRAKFRVESLQQLGLIRHGQGKLDDALVLLTDAVAAARTPGLDDQLVNTLLHLGNLQAARGRFQDAETAWTELSQRAGAHQPGVRAQAALYMGRLRRDQNRYEEASEYLEAALAGVRAVQGPESVQAADAAYDLARLRSVQGRSDEAMTLLDEALRLHRAALGETHPRVIDDLTARATASLNTGNTADALSDVRQAFDLSTAGLGDEHPTTARTLDILAEIYLRSGDYPQAAETWRRSLAIFHAAYGEQHPDVAYIRWRLGCCLVESGQAQDGRALLALARPVLQQAHGADDHRVRGVDRCLAAH